MQGNGGEIKMVTLSGDKRLEVTGTEAIPNPPLGDQGFSILPLHEIACERERVRAFPCQQVIAIIPTSRLTFCKEWGVL